MVDGRSAFAQSNWFSGGGFSWGDHVHNVKIPLHLTGYIVSTYSPLTNAHVFKRSYGIVDLFNVSKPQILSETISSTVPAILQLSWFSEIFLQRLRSLDPTDKRDNRNYHRKRKQLLFCLTMIEKKFCAEIENKRSLLTFHTPLTDFCKAVSTLKSSLLQLYSFLRFPYTMGLTYR